MGLRTALLLFLAAPLSAGDVARMEIVSRLGRSDEVKLYSGETATFRARELRQGMDGIFGAGDFLHGVTFTLRAWPRVEQDATGIVKGANRRVVTRQEPGPELWGEPPSRLTVRGGEPGRYRLIAEKPGFETCFLTLHLARFEIVDIEAEISERHYRADFDVRLVDPDEKGSPIPIRVESLDEAGRLLDSRTDLTLVPVVRSPGEYRLSRRIRLGSTELESFRERLARRDEEPLPTGFLDTKPLRIAAGGKLRLAFRSVSAVYPLPFGYQ